MTEHFRSWPKGEEMAKNYLVEKGYNILETNWKSGKNEVDIIALDGEFLVVVEVKTRQSNKLVEPEAAVNKDKQRALIRAANAYVRSKNRQEEVRFDIISILLGPAGNNIHHIPRAFYATMF